MEAEEEDDERENGGSDGIVEVVKKEKTKGKGKFHCVYCNKKFKSEKQHENHVKSKAHIKAEKQALRKQAKADKKASKGQNQPVNEKDADADADEAYELAALNAASKKKRKKKQQKRGGRTTEVGATDARAVSLLKQLDEDMEEKVAGTEKMSKREIAKLKQHKRKKAKQGAKKSTPTPNDGDSDEN